MSTTEDKATLAFRCVDIVDPSDSEELQAMVDRSKEVDFKTFAQHVDWKPTARLMGYSTAPGEPGMLLEKDWAVRFYSSTWRKEPVFFMDHSAIEFVFRKQDASKTIRPADAWGGMEAVDTSAQAKPAAARTRKPRP